MQQGMRVFLLVAVFTQAAVYLSEGETCSEDVGSASGKYPSFFTELTTSEINRVLRYIKKEFKAKISTESGLNDSFAYVIERKITPKKDAISYIDLGGEEPVREARVVLYTPAEIAEYTIGPLPNLTYHFRTENPKWSRRKLRFTDRTFLTPSDLMAMDKVVHKEGQKLRQLLEESFDGFHMDNDCHNRCISYNFLRTSVWHDSRLHWLYLKRKVDISLGSDRLYPLPLQILLNMTSTDASRWSAIEIWYNDQFFSSSDDLMMKYNNGEVTKVTIPFNDADTVFSSMRRRHEEYSEDNRKRGPDCFPQDGRRFSVDRNRMKYLNWEFTITHRQSTGPQLFDIRFRNERIVYELSLQEAFLLYTGNTPLGRNANLFLDGEVTLGTLISPLAPGIDCPKGATYFNTSIYSFYLGKGVIVPNAFCVFEYTDGPPLKRHYEYTLDGRYEYYAGMPNNALVLRTMQTIDNYDNIYDFVFYQNGVLGIKVGASGYVATEHTSNRKAKSGKNGFQIYDNVYAMLHQHLFNFKVDMDIQGRSNRHETLGVKVRQAVHSVGDNIKDKTFEQYIKTNLKRTEKKATYRFKYSEPKFFLFYNKDAPRSKLNYNKAYYLDNQGASRFLFPDFWSKMGSAAWAKYQDDEDTSSTIYNSFNQLDPVLNFDTYITNNENITDEDLVAWVTVGLQHLPTTATDIPVTTTAGNVRSFYLRPFNYFDEDPSMTSHDNVFITPGQNGETVVVENKNNEKDNCSPPKDDTRFIGPILD